MLKKIEDVVFLEKLPIFLYDYLEKFCNQPLLFLLKGDLGAGKTTFVQQCCCLLGINDVVRSPTFNLLNIYPSSFSFSVYHYDLYRLNRDDTLQDLVELNKPLWVFVEWYHHVNFNWISFAREYNLDILYVFLSLNKGVNLELSRKIVIDPLVL